MTFKLKDDPQEYTLQFDFNELADAEPVLECNLMAAIAAWPNLACRQMRALLYALLKKAHPAVLPEEAGELLTRDTKVVLAAVKQALLDGGVLELEEPAPQEPVKTEPSAAAE